VSLTARKSLGLFLLAAVTRALFLAYLVPKLPGMWHWGINEAGVIGRSLLVTHSFSSPFHDATGPSAWLAPVYPVLVSAVFVVFGIQTPASGLAVIALNALCSALVSVVLYKLGKEFLSESAGLIAGLFWAVSPAVAIMPMIIWDTCVSTLLTTLAVLYTLRLTAPEERAERKFSLGFAGGLWGLAGLSSPALLAPLPFLGLWLWISTRRLKAAAVFVSGAAMVLLPWTLRNYLTFHKFIPVRSNFWAEMSWGNLGWQNHATGGSMEYQRLGEVQFGAVSKQRVVVYLHDHFGEFLQQTLHRSGEFWIIPEGIWRFSFFLTLTAVIGLLLMARKHFKMASAFGIILLTYPVVYYISFVFSRYRYPVEPILYLSVAFLLDEAIKRGPTRRNQAEG
jgi:4-amino-4-deoxy-L-arabinose transferase-like glycosyltransferase